MLTTSVLKPKNEDVHDKERKRHTHTPTHAHTRGRVWMQKITHKHQMFPVGPGELVGLEVCYLVNSESCFHY